MGQVIFVVCRESVEALLVIGILYSWLNKHPEAARGKKFLIGGLVAGLALAVLLALALVGTAHFFGETGQVIFQACMLLVAAFLIVQMVFWMRKHAQGLRKDLEHGLQQNADRENWWGVCLLTVIAVAREGSETVVFLSGSFLGLRTAQDFGWFFLAAGIGLISAFALFYLLQVGSRFISWRIFFRVTEILLLLLGCSLFMNAVSSFYDLAANYNVPDWFYVLNGSAYDISGILDDATGVGSLLASIAAYRSHPAWIELAASVLYWIAVVIVLAASKTGKHSDGGATPKNKNTYSKHIAENF